MRTVTNENAGFDQILLRVSNVGGEVKVEGETNVPEGAAIGRIENGKFVFERAGQSPNDNMSGSQRSKDTSLSAV